MHAEPLSLCGRAYLSGAAALTVLEFSVAACAQDTEFPGVVARPGGTARTSQDYAYQTLRCNVDMLKIIQLGLCFCDAQGNIHPGTCTWQFNFHFSLTSDMYAQDSIDLLSKSGIDFVTHEKDGINPSEFGEWLCTSGIVLNEEIKWYRLALSERSEHSNNSSAEQDNAAHELTCVLLACVFFTGFLSTPVSISVTY